MQTEIKIDAFKQKEIPIETVMEFVKSQILLLNGQTIRGLSMGSGKNKNMFVYINDNRIISIDPTNAKDLSLITLENFDLSVRAENLLRKYRCDNLQKIIETNQGLKKLKGFGSKSYTELVETVSYFLEKHKISDIDIQKIM